MALTAGGMWAQTTGTLNVPEVKRAAGTVRQVIVVKGGERQGVIKVELATNGVAYRDLQFDLTLPEGIKLVNPSKDVDLAEVYSDGHSMAYNTLSDGTVRFVYFSATADLLQDGVIYEIPINVDPSFEQAQASLVETYASDNEVVPDDHSFPVGNFDIVALQLGDVNDSGLVEIGDYVAIINNIIKNGKNAVFVKEVADVNGDATSYDDDERIGEIGDAVGVINIINKVVTAPAKSSAPEKFEYNLDPQ